MTRVLLIKTSSLGDVIHCLPAVTDMVRNVPGLWLDWMIEEQWAEVVRMHPGVHRELPVQLRSWRRHPLRPGTWSEFGAFRRQLGYGRYDHIIDAQGLIRSALLARLAPGVHSGYDRESVREPPASYFYDRKYPVSVTLHAAERIRRLAAQALDYPLPPELDYGLQVQVDRPGWPTANRYLVFLHATARRDKSWGMVRWKALALKAAKAGFVVVAPWGTDKERQRSKELVEAAPGGITPPRLGYRELASLLAGAAAVVGVDTGLTHLASAVGAPTVALYTASWSELNGVIGPAFISNLGGPGTPPSIDDVWAQTQRAIGAGGKQGSWEGGFEPAPELAGHRRFRPSKRRVTTPAKTRVKVRVRVRRGAPEPGDKD